MKGISVVIPNYNGVQLFPTTLPSVFEALKIAALPHEVIVADDCSNDNSVAWLYENYSQIKIISNKKNSGFSVTCNKGVQAALYDKVLLLNSDVKLTPKYFVHQLGYFNNEKTFGVMGRIVGWDDDVIQDGAKYLRFHGAKIKTSGNYILQDEALMKEGLYSIYLSGANAFVDKEKFLLIGGFNEMFSPFYVEDYELSLRAWRLGFICWFDYESVCRHRVSYTIKSGNKKRNVKAVYYRNKLFLHALHLDGWRKFFWIIQTGLSFILKTLMLQLYFTRAYIMYLGSFKKIKQSRQKFNYLSKKTGNKKSTGEVAETVLQSIKTGMIKF